MDDISHAYHDSAASLAPQKSGSFSEGVDKPQSKKLFACSVPTCRKNNRKNPSLHFLKFPSDKKRCSRWVKAVGDPDLVHVPMEKLCTLRRVCSEHFISRDFSGLVNAKGKVRLSSTAIPHIFDPSVEPLSDELMKDFVGYVNEKCAGDHTEEAVEACSTTPETYNQAQAGSKQSSACCGGKPLATSTVSHLLKVHPMRIGPGKEVTSFLLNFVASNHLKAAFIITCVGSVSSVDLRFATAEDGNLAVSPVRENLEICSLVGTVCQDGFHLHGTFGNSSGATVSGHVIGNMIVQTTAELVLGEATDFHFSRVFDQSTGFRELFIKDVNDSS